MMGRFLPRAIVRRIAGAMIGAVMRADVMVVIGMAMNLSDANFAAAIRHVQPSRSMTESDHAAQQTGEGGSEQGRGRGH